MLTVCSIRIKKVIFSKTFLFFSLMYWYLLTDNKRDSSMNLGSASRNDIRVGILNSDLSVFGSR